MNQEPDIIFNGQGYFLRKSASLQPYLRARFLSRHLSEGLPREQALDFIFDKKLLYVTWTNN